VRTASVGVSKTGLNKDLQFLKRLWKEVRRKGGQETAPALIYQEADLAKRAVRDYLSEDVGEVWVDNEEIAKDMTEFAQIIFPRSPNLIKVHKDPERSLWDRFNIQKQLEQIYSREVALPSGGRLVFDHTEALTAIDINSGKTGGKATFHETALKTNLEAAEAIAQQLKLRDIGGQIVIDFIEMKDKKHWAAVEKDLKQAMKTDRARHDVGRMSKFGLLQVVRQRLGSSAISLSTEACPCCGGTGIRRNLEWQAQQVLKDINRCIRRKDCPSPFEYKTESELAFYLLNNKRQLLQDLERDSSVNILIGAK